MGQPEPLAIYNGLKKVQADLLKFLITMIVGFLTITLGSSCCGQGLTWLREPAEDLAVQKHHSLKAVDSVSLLDEA